MDEFVLLLQLLLVIEILRLVVELLSGFDISSERTLYFGGLSSFCLKICRYIFLRLKLVQLRCDIGTLWFYPILSSIITYGVRSLICGQLDGSWVHWTSWVPGNVSFTLFIEFEKLRDWITLDPSIILVLLVSISGTFHFLVLFQILMPVVLGQSFRILHRKSLRCNIWHRSDGSAPNPIDWADRLILF